MWQITTSYYQPYQAENYTRKADYNEAQDETLCYYFLISFNNAATCICTESEVGVVHAFKTFVNDLLTR
jgi:hypothetical protein